MIRTPWTDPVLRERSAPVWPVDEEARALPDGDAGDPAGGERRDMRPCRSAFDHAAMAQRRLERIVNASFSGLHPFSAPSPGVGSGSMIAPSTAAALVAQDRSLAAPGSLDGATTSALQEDFRAHPAAEATKPLAMVDDAERLRGIERLAGTDLRDLLPRRDWAAGMAALLVRVRAPPLPDRDDGPVAGHPLVGRDLVRGGLAPAW